MRHEDAGVARVVVRGGARGDGRPTARPESRPISAAALGRRGRVQHAQSRHPLHAGRSRPGEKTRVKGDRARGKGGEKIGQG